MDGQYHSNSGSESKRQSRWDRSEQASRLAWAEGLQRVAGLSGRSAAEAVGVPSSTLHHWQKRKSDQPASHGKFFESPEGVEFLTRLVAASHLCFGQIAPGGTRLLCRFFQLIELDQLIPCSYGSQQAYSVAMQELLGQFSEEEAERLAPQMEHREISICVDETFHPEMCLVGMEPTSNFAFLEEYAANRDAQTWNERVKRTLKRFPVTIVQATSDQARSLIKFIREMLGAHDSPDLFHIQQEITRALLGKTRYLVERARQAWTKAKKDREALQAEKSQSEAVLHLFYDRQIQLSEAAEHKKRTELEFAESQKSDVHDDIRRLSTAYHPFDLSSGAPRSVEKVTRDLNDCFQAFENRADQLEISADGRRKLAKARRVLPKMIKTIAFFWSMVDMKLSALQLAPDERTELERTLLPACYLQTAAGKASCSRDRATLLDLAEDLHHRAREGPLAKMSPARQQEVRSVVQQCADLFQRSSSCVEGRNGYLALQHHGLHRLTPRQLRALTTIHNYFIRRADQTTPAERFFRQKHRDLFEWLIERLPPPGRPRAVPSCN